MSLAPRKKLGAVAAASVDLAAVAAVVVMTAVGKAIAVGIVVVVAADSVVTKIFRF
jgi:hypothetical protein